jgi:transposase
MSAQDTQSLKERREHLERQLRALKENREGLYMPGVTVVSGQTPVADEQTHLQVEELEAAIAQIDEALKDARGH